MFRGIMNFGSMLKQASQLNGKLQGLSDELKKKTVTGSAGAGLVEVEVNGLGQVLRLKLDPQLMERKDVEMLEDLIPAAVNQAIEKSKSLHAEALQGLTGGFNFGGAPPPVDLPE